MARDTDSLTLHHLADQMEHAGQKYIAATNRRTFDVLMQDDQPEAARMSKAGNIAAVTIDELDAALAA